MSVLAVVPTLGTRPDLLENAVVSLADQRVDTMTIVIVTPHIDDPSTEQIARQFGTGIRKDPGSGLAAALNQGIAAAIDHDYFLWLNDDDVLLPGAVDACIEKLEADPSVVMVYGNIEYIDPRGNHLTMSRLGPTAQWLMTFGPNLVPQPGSIARLSSVRSVGSLDESLHYALDQDLFLRLRREGRIIHIDRTLAKYTWHPDALTVQNRQSSIREAERVRRRYRGSVGRVIAVPADIATRLVVTVASRHLTKRAGRAKDQ